MDETALPLRTGRLLLRPYRHQDSTDLHRFYSRPDVARLLLDHPWTIQDAETRIGERLARTGLTTESGTLAVVVEAGGAVVGDVTLWATNDERSTAEIGWVFDPDHSGHGYATEAATAMLDVAFGTYGLHRVVAQMDGRNTASARLCERLGMRREAHHRENWWSKGEWTDTIVYAMLGREWRARADTA